MDFYDGTNNSLNYLARKHEEFDRLSLPSRISKFRRHFE